MLFEITDRPPTARLRCGAAGCQAVYVLPQGRPLAATHSLAQDAGWTWRAGSGLVCPAHPHPATIPVTHTPATHTQGDTHVRQPALHRPQHDGLPAGGPGSDGRWRRPALAGTPPLTLGVIVPAYNEAASLPDTLACLLRQTVPVQQIIVVDDGSTDRTAEVAAAFPGVTVLTTPTNTGSKAKAQNYALGFVRTDLVLTLDADTVLADDYVELIKEPFADERVTIAAGAVQARFARTATERGRQIEYLLGFSFSRAVQAKVNAPAVCSGCCSVFRVSVLKAAGGLPEGTVTEDLDYTWTQQLSGARAVYVGAAVCWAIEPPSIGDMRKQTWRWMAGYVQCVRKHAPRMVRRKKWLALWTALALFDMAVTPLWWLWALGAALLGGLGTTLLIVGGELMVMLPILGLAVRRHSLNPWRVLANIPFVYVNRAINGYYAWKALAVELALVPLGLSSGLTVFEKGRSQVPAAAGVAS